MPRTTPGPRLLDTAVTHSAPAPTAPLPRQHPFLVFAATVLAIAILAAGAAQLWIRYESTAPTRPLSVLKPIRQALPTPPRSPLEIGPDSLHVSAIVLGAEPLAVVNGKQLAAGDWLEVRTSNGVAALHVLKIEDGAVQFGYAGKIISARFDGRSPEK